VPFFETEFGWWGPVLRLNLTIWNQSFEAVIVKSIAVISPETTIAQYIANYRPDQKLIDERTTEFNWEVSPQSDHSDVVSGRKPSGVSIKRLFMHPKPEWTSGIVHLDLLISAKSDPQRHWHATINERVPSAQEFVDALKGHEIRIIKGNG
jgi:hypothetical protein